MRRLWPAGSSSGPTTCSGGTGTGVPFAVVKKYGDDEGGQAAALLTYYGFLSVFPLLLLGVAIVSRVLVGNPELRRRLIAAIVPPVLRSTVEHALTAFPTSTVRRSSPASSACCSRGRASCSPPTRCSTLSPPFRGGFARVLSPLRPGVRDAHGVCSGRWRSARSRWRPRRCPRPPGWNAPGRLGSALVIFAVLLLGGEPAAGPARAVPCPLARGRTGRHDGDPTARLAPPLLARLVTGRGPSTAASPASPAFSRSST